VPLPFRARSLPPAALAVALAVVLVACGQGGTPSVDATKERAVKACRAQWHDVGESVAGLDQDPNPSSLAQRWTTVIATVEYYQTTDSAKNCQANVETQLKAVTALRQFSEKLRPYDMTYQLSQVRAAIDLYLHDPLPDPVRGQTGKKVQPPSKDAVTQAMATLTANADQANEELAPAWGQTVSVDLEDVSALTTTMQDLDQLAQDSPHWLTCEQALQVLVAAVRAQEGLPDSAGPSSPSSSPSGASTPGG
jgi:hypothetical protein